jgi:predicted metal-dependent HD superfamily phosphohydrolase
MISSVSKYCTDLLTTSKCKELPFHNLEHTKEVVQNVKYLCAAMDINEQDTVVLLVAAWFHDTGFSMTYKGHEDQSKTIASNFLKQNKVDTGIINKVKNCIDATKMPQNPTTKLAKILCDADIFHTNIPHFFYRKLLLRLEWEMFCNVKTTDKEWHLLNLKFLVEHNYKTEYGINYMEAGKLENINKLKQVLEFYE